MAGADDDGPLLPKEEGGNVYIEGGVDPRVKAKFSNVSTLRRVITAEPTMLLYFMTFIPLIPLTQQYVLKQVEEKMNISVQSQNNSAGCVASTANSTDELHNIAQAKASEWMIFFNLVLFLPGLFSTTLLGSYSDQKGRKVGLVLPLMGGIARCGFSIVVTALDLPIEWLAVGLAVEGLSGGVATFIMAGFSYIADVTSHRQRSSRIFLLEVALGIGTVVANLAIGFLIPLIGYVYCYVLCTCLHTLNLLYVIFIVIETREKDPDVRLFSVTHFVKIFKMFLKDNDDKRRWKLLLAMFLLFLSCCIELGGSDNITYFQIHRPICFTPVLIGFWQAANYATRNLGGGITVKLLNKRLGDTGLMIAGCLSGMAFYLLVAFTDTVIMMFAIIPVSFLYSLITPMVRSFTSKLCSKDEQGTAFAGIAMTQTLAIVAGDSAFNSIYAATVHTNRGLVFIIDAAILCFGLLLTVVLIVGIRRETTKYRALVHIIEESPTTSPVW